MTAAEAALTDDPSEILQQDVLMGNIWPAARLFLPPKTLRTRFSSWFSVEEISCLTARAEGGRDGGREGG